MAEQPKARRRNTREELIKAGVEEINRYGVAGFSMRRIAQLCGVSCGAPYKHFGDRKEFIRRQRQMCIRDRPMKGTPGSRSWR